MTNEFSSLFSPLKLGRSTMRNRLAVAPMTRVTATETGIPTDTMAAYYARFAKGGFGLVITEGSYIDHTYSQTYAYQAGLADNEQARGWGTVVDGIHAGGALAVAQIQHAGALSQGNRYRDVTVGPSSVRPKGEQMNFYRGTGLYPIPRELSEEEIADVIASFGETAVRAVRVAGFDGVEIHGANGYLLDQFLTDFSNQRNDRWGGSLENRVRIAVEVAKTVRSSIGDQAIVGIRLSQGKVNDFFHKWQEHEEAAETFFGALKDAGLDYVHVTEFEAWKPAFDEAGPSLVHLARRYAPGLAVISNGSLHDADRAVASLEDGADIVSLGRGRIE